MGVSPPSLTSGSRQQVLLDVQVVLRSSLVTTASVVDDVMSSLTQFEKKLGARVDLYDIEDAIRNNLAYAKAVRVTLTPDPDLTSDELDEWEPLNIKWDEYFEFQPRVQLLDKAQDFYTETASPAQAN